MDNPLIKVVQTKPEAENQKNQMDNPPMRNVDTPSRRTLDKLDHHILILISEKCHENAIVKFTKRPRSTIKHRLSRLKKWGFIKPYYFNTALQRVKLFELTQKGTQILIYNEEQHGATCSEGHAMTTHTPFTSHAMSFKFPIHEGKQPKSPRAYKMKNWLGYVFEYTNHVIRTTPSNIIIDVNLDLKADTVDNLILKYSLFAQKYVLEFAERHNVTVGQCQTNRSGHYNKENIPFIQLIAERGEFQSKDVKIDKSRSNGDLEFNEESARGFEFVLNQMPTIVAKLCTKIDHIEKVICKDPKAEKTLKIIDFTGKQKKLEEI